MQVEETGNALWRVWVRTVSAEPKYRMDHSIQEKHHFVQIQRPDPMQTLNAVDRLPGILERFSVRWHTRKPCTSSGNRLLRSKSGWAVAALYLLASLLLLVHSAQCRDGFFCGVGAVPMLVPAGFAYLLLLADHVPSPAALQWPVFVPSMLTNAVLYYLLGALLGRLSQGRRTWR